MSAHRGDQNRDFLDVVSSRKSVRSWEDRPVPRELVEEVVRIGAMAPSNCNQQLWNVIALEDRAVRERLVAEAAGNTMLLRMPLALVVTYDGWNYKEAMQGAALMVGHMVLAAESLGLSALPMNSYGADSGVRRVLDIPESEAICCFVALGYADDKAKERPPVPRRPASEFLHWNRYEGRPRPSFSYDPDRWTGETLAGHHRYYCRKTTPGKEMDIMSVHERRLVQTALEGTEGPWVDLVSYDGAYLREYPAPPVTVDLTEATAAYSHAAGLNAGMETINEVFEPDAQRLPVSDAGTVGMMYKAERVPRDLRRDLLRQAHASLKDQGEFVLVSRKRHPFLSLFFASVQVVFGRDVRKTGIFAFFGPYLPVSVGSIVEDMRNAGFREVRWTGHFLLPAFCDRLYQMLLQYRASEGSSYLHRRERRTWIARMIEKALELQGLRRFGFLGSVAVIRGRK